MYGTIYIYIYIYKITKLLLGMNNMQTTQGYLNTSGIIKKNMGSNQKLRGQS